MKAKHALLAINVLLIAVLSCNLSGGQTAGAPDLAGTITAQAQTLQAPSGTPALSATPTNTATVTPTFTPSVPQVSVSSATNCRTGQGVNFDLVFTMNPGQMAEVVGKDTPDNYWVIKNPAGGTCWLWGQYATVTGNISGIPDVAPLPTPTPSEPAAPRNFHATSSCTASGQIFVSNIHVSLTWTDVATNEDGYHIFRGNDLLVTLGANSTSFEDDTTLFHLILLIGTPKPPPTITYGVEAFNGAGHSARKEVSIGCP
jgi:hypothetical protein